jgi:hypothetical protein
MKRKKNLIDIIAALLLTFCTLALTKVEAAAPGEEIRLSELEEIHFELLGATGDPTLDVALVDIDGRRYALVTNGFFQVMDVSEPSNPRIVARITLQGDTRAISVVGQRAFVATTEELAVVDLSNPEATRLISSTKINNAIGESIFANDRYVFVAALVEHPRISTVRSGSVSYSGTQLTGALLIMDVQNDEPTMVARLDLDAPVRDVFADDGYTFLATDDGLVVVDVTKPQQPTVVGSLTELSQTNGVVILGEYALVVNTEGFSEVDIHNPSQPTLITNMLTDVLATDVFAMDNIALVTSSDGRLFMVDFATIENPRVVNTVETAGNAVAVAAIDGCAAVALSDAGIVLVDVSDPTASAVLSRLILPGVPLDSVYSDGYLFIPYMNDEPFISGGLAIVDVKDPESPRLVGSAVTPAPASGIAINGRYAYVAYGVTTSVPSYVLATSVGRQTALFNYLQEGPETGGLMVVDVQDPRNPKPLGTVTTPGWGIGIAMVGEYVLVPVSTSGVAVVDASDPMSPELTGNIDMLTPSGEPGRAVVVGTAGEYAVIGYIVDKPPYPWGLAIVALSDSGQPQIVSNVTFECCSEPTAIRTFGNYIWTQHGSGVTIVDIRDPKEPLVVAMESITGEGFDIFVTDTQAFAATTRGVVIIDTANPEKPTALGRLESSLFVITISSESGYIFAGCLSASEDLNGEVAILDASIKPDWRIMGTIAGMGIPHRMTISDDHAFVVTTDEYNHSKLVVVDIGDPSEPQVIGAIDLAFGGLEYGLICDIAVWNDTALVAAVGTSIVGVLFIDIRDPQNPELLGSISTRGIPLRIATGGGYAYVGVTTDTGDPPGILTVIDVRVPAKAKVVARAELPAEAAKVSVSDGCAYVAAGVGLIIVDIQDAEQPHEIGKIEIPGTCWEVSTFGSYAFVTPQNGGIVVVDVSDPQAPEIVRTVMTPGVPLRLVMKENRGFLATRVDPVIEIFKQPSVVEGEVELAPEEYGIVVLDIQDLSNPVVTGKADLPGSVTDISVSEGHLFVATQEFGLLIAEVSTVAGISAAIWIWVGIGLGVIVVGLILYMVRRKIATEAKL